MMGLDMVKGPHWSMILSLFGQNGQISDVLRDRSQVQLKDKARNLKLFFLKSNSEMPFFLSQVTGELKTRAPGQAARKEAEDREKARLTSEEQQARVQGIMTLAAGLQDPPQNQHRAQMTPSQAPGSTGATTAQPQVKIEAAPQLQSSLHSVQRYQPAAQPPMSQPTAPRHMLPSAPVAGTAAPSSVSRPSPQHTRAYIPQTQAVQPRPIQAQATPPPLQLPQAQSQTPSQTQTTQAARAAVQGIPQAQAAQLSAALNGNASDAAMLQGLKAVTDTAT